MLIVSASFNKVSISIIIIIKCIYIAQDREKLQMRWLTVTNMSVSERRQRDVWCTKFSRKTVPHSRSFYLKLRSP